MQLARAKLQEPPPYRRRQGCLRRSLQRHPAPAATVPLMAVAPLRRRQLMTISDTYTPPPAPPRPAPPPEMFLESDKTLIEAPLYYGLQS